MMIKKGYKKKTRKDIFLDVLIKHSVEKDKTKVFLEWIKYTGMIEKNEIFCICGQPILKIYEIHNKINFKKLQVGSCCITKFGIEKIRVGTKKAYLQACYFGCKNIGETDFIKNALIRLWAPERYSKYDLCFSGKEITALERLSGKTWMWKTTL